MTSRFINGAKHAVSTAVTAAAAITGISNANPAVASAASPPAAGSFVIIKSNWPELNDTVAKVGTVTAGTFVLLGVDTSDLNRFPAGEGAGTFQVASSFVSLSQVRDVDQSGGEQQFYTYQNVEDPSSRQRQDPTYKNPMVIRVDMAYDPALPWYETLIELDRTREPTVLREILPGGDTILYFGIMSFNKVPTKKVNEHMMVSATFSLYADPIRYDAV